ncbi:hypothetical protein ABZ917_17810 [Nonomuraea wenchangensis]
MTDLLPCCQQAALDGTSPVDHYRVCEARTEDPQREALFDLPADALAQESPRTDPDVPGTVRNTSGRSGTEASDA